MTEDGFFLLRTIVQIPNRLYNPMELKGAARVKLCGAEKEGVGTPWYFPHELAGTPRLRIGSRTQEDMLKYAFTYTHLTLRDSQYGNHIS